VLYAVEAEPRAYVIRCPAAYNAPVVSTMTSCINDVNSAARFGEQTKRAAESRPSRPHYPKEHYVGGEDVNRDANCAPNVNNPSR
jgi:hypothetical protein